MASKCSWSGHSRCYSLAAKEGVSPMETVSKIRVTCLKAIVIGATVIGGSLAGMSVMADEGALTQEQAQTAVDARQAAFDDLKTNFKPLGGMLKGKVAMDADLVATNAASMAEISKTLTALYAIDTSGFSIENRSDVKIWTSMDDFSAKAVALENAALALNTVAQSGDEKAIKAAMINVGQTCKSCHTEYRTE